MLRNDGGKGFQDVTFSGGFGHLQKGHGIAFADVNNDGHVDVSISLGGGVVGDKMFDALFLNPGTFFHNSWLKLSLVGVKSNKLGQGARLKVTTADGRNIYMTQGLTASFGSNPVKIQHIGLGDIGPDGVVNVEIAWPIAGAAPQTLRAAPSLRFARPGSRPESESESEPKSRTRPFREPSPSPSAESGIRTPSCSLVCSLSDSGCSLNSITIKKK